jgi:fructoselysine 6-kinase
VGEPEDRDVLAKVGPPSVAVVGDNTIDSYVGARTAKYVGGNAVNVAVKLATRRAGVAYFGAVGRDTEGEFIHTVLKRYPLDLGGLVEKFGASALTRIRLTTAGDRVFESEDFGVTADYFPGPEAILRIASADWVHIGMLPRAAELVQLLVQLNPRLMLSQDCAVSTGYTALAVAFDSVGENRAAARTMAAAAIRGGARLSVVTMGEFGAIAFDGQTWWEQPAEKADVIDTTGAGDSFIAGFADARMNSASIPRALVAGARWASATCEHIAGFPQ